MSAIINAIDSFTPTRLGENEHLEYDWSHDFQEKIVQLNFQMVRKANIKTTLSSLLTQLKYKHQHGEPVIHLLSTLFKLISYTRDIDGGKGEKLLTYDQILVWYEIFPKAAKLAIKNLVNTSIGHQYGSWADINRLCTIIKNKYNCNHELIQLCTQLYVEQLHKDEESLKENIDRPISLAGKWAPREKSKDGWLFEILAQAYYPNIQTKISNKKSNALKYCKQKFRLLCSKLNKHLNTTQVKQCAKQWSTIDFKQVTSITMSKQTKAFQNLTKKGDQRSTLEDRIVCANKFKTFVENAVAKPETQAINGKRCSMEDFVSRCLKYKSPKDKIDIDVVNSQWISSSESTKALGNMIPMVDVSGSMEGTPMNVAIALGIRISEHSALKNRILTFSSKPTWVNLDGINTFYDKVNVVKMADWGMNTNFEAALRMILDAIVQKQLRPEEVSNMILVILSDMQMDAGDKCDKVVLYQNMRNMYANAGNKVWGKPYEPPHILFWNLRATGGFPSLSLTHNTSMMSGYDPSVLECFVNEGIEGLKSYTPWSMLLKLLSKSRYELMELTPELLL